MSRIYQLIRFLNFLVLIFVCVLLCQAQTVHISADYSKLAGYPLQKTQFGVSYVNPGAIHMENVYDLLKVRNSRNNDKRLTRTWKGWDLNNEPIYERDNHLSTLLENAGMVGAVGGANLQGPYEHPAVETYRISSQIENEWDWDTYSHHSMLYYKHLRSLVDATGKTGWPFVFGLGHESNNDCNLETMGLGSGCLDGIAFMGNLESFYDLVINNGNQEQGDIIQAGIFFGWYKKTIDMMLSSVGDRGDFLIAAAQPHTHQYAIPTYFKTIKDSIDNQKSPNDYIPDYIGSHSRWNIPGDDRFFRTIVNPGRGLFNDKPLWQTVPVMCNEFGIHDFQTAYQQTMLGAVRMLNNFELMLMSPDIAYVNYIYNNYLVTNNGNNLLPGFHAFRFYQNMPQSRTTLSGNMPTDMHVLSSRSEHSKQSALLWRDESGTGNYTVNFTFENASEQWTKARAKLYVISNTNIEAPMFSSRTSEDYGLAEYMADGYPKEVAGIEHIRNYTFPNIPVPRAAIVLIEFERIDEDTNQPIPDEILNNTGPEQARYIKTWQWCARVDEDIVDPSWGFFDTRNWTLFAGIDNNSGSGGSVEAAYLSDNKVKRGLAGAEFSSANASLGVKVNVEKGDVNPDSRNVEAIAALRIDFYNGNTNEYDGAVVIAGNCLPSLEQYSKDYVPWGFGGTDSNVVPQKQILGQIYDGHEWIINLDDEYRSVTNKSSADDFIAGGRRIIVSAWVENIESGLVVRLTDPGNIVTSVKDRLRGSRSEINVYPVPSKHVLHIDGINDGDKIKIVAMDGGLILSTSNRDNQIDIGSLSKGLYIVLVNNKYGAKFVKE